MTAGGERALFRRYPAARRVPWVSLGDFPTPVISLPRLAGHIGAASVHMKREDVAARAYGGSKVRPLEFLLGAALSAGARRVITSGAYGSHLVLATAIHGARVGLPVSAVLYPQPAGGEVEETLRRALGAGADLRGARSLVTGYLLYRRTIARARRSEGGLVSVVPPGGASAAGALGFVDLAHEIREQIDRGELPPPDVIHVAAGSCTSLAGLAVGLPLCGLTCRIVATRVVPRPVTARLRVGRLIRRTARLAFALTGRLVTPLPVEIDHAHAGPGYGRASRTGDAAADLFRELEAVGLDATYTAKAAAGLVAAARAPGRPLAHLFIHTWADPALAATEPRVTDVADPVLAAILGRPPKSL